MKISFDLDGTAWKYRRFFGAIARSLMAAGHQVGVLTAHSDDIRQADLRLLAARGFPTPHFFYNASDIDRAGIIETDLRDRKIAFAAKMGIDCHIDDFDDRHPGEVEMVMIGQADQSHD